MANPTLSSGKNPELKNYLQQLNFVTNSCDCFTMEVERFANDNLESYKNIVQRFVNTTNSHLSILSNTSNYSHNSNVFKILSVEGKTKNFWINTHYSARDQLRKVVKLGTDLFSSNEKFDELKLNFENERRKLANEILELHNMIIQSLIYGEIDYCILPRKSNIGCYDSPSHGTIVAFRFADSGKINESFEKEMWDEARRVAFQHNAWEDSENNKDQLQLFFFDWQKNPDVNHSVRALQTAIEIIARITYKYALSAGDYKEAKNPKHEKYNFQRIAVVLHSYEEVEYDLSSQRAELVKTVLNDSQMQFKNTIIVIGDEIFRALKGNFQAYNMKFSKNLQNYKNSNHSIFWSKPIGWETLQIFLAGSPNVENYKYIERKTRYHVPGQIKVRFSLLNGLQQEYEGIIADISRSGIYIICGDTINIGEHSNNPEIKFIHCNNCFDKIRKRKGTLIEHGSFYQDTQYLRIKFKTTIKPNKLINFLTLCNIDCNIEERECNSFSNL